MRNYMNTYQVAKSLGVNIQTVRHYIRKGELRAARVGKKYVITQEDIDDFLAGRKEVRNLERLTLTEKGRRRIEKVREVSENVLTYLEECPGADLSELAESLGFPRGEISRALRRLEGKRLAYCEPRGEKPDREKDPWFALPRRKV